MTLLMVIQPINYLSISLAKSFHEALTGGSAFCEYGGEDMGEAESIYFVAPKNLLTAFLWLFLKDFSLYVTNFMICGTNSDAIGHTFKDTIMDKYFWRELLVKSGAEVPKELGRFKNNRLLMFEDFKTADIVLKIPDSYLGIGDKFLVFGEDFSTVGDIEEIIQTEKIYNGKEVLVLSWIRPKEEMGVHLLDFLTISSADEGFKVANVILWTDCTGPTTHTCQSGYLVDVETETITGTTPWYSAHFANQKKELVGLKIPGVKTALRQAVRAHELIPHKWCRAIGWDCMITRDGTPVFFEGNLAAHRVPRRVSLHYKIADLFLKALPPLKT